MLYKSRLVCINLIVIFLFILSSFSRSNRAVFFHGERWLYRVKHLLSFDGVEGEQILMLKGIFSFLYDDSLCQSSLDDVL